MSEDSEEDPSSDEKPSDDDILLDGQIAANAENPDVEGEWDIYHGARTDTSTDTDSDDDN